MNLHEIEDSWESKSQAAYDAAEQLGTLPHIYIVSHKRTDPFTLKTIPVLRELATVVVADPEFMDYSLELPDVDVAAIPPGFGGFDIGVGRAKQFCLDLATSRGESEAMILDDDLQSLSILYSIGEGKVSHAYTRHVGERREAFHTGLLVMVAQIARDAFAADPKAVLAAPQCNNANRTPGSAGTMWETNRGGVPAQITFWDVDRFNAALPLGIDLQKFNFHGDDIGVACDLIAAGSSVVNIPSIIGQYLDYETQSVVRTPETAPRLRLAEHEALMSHELAPFIKTREDLLGQPQWHSLDWRLLEHKHKVTTTKQMWAEGLL